MSYAIQHVILGVPMTREATALIEEWEEDESSPWNEDDDKVCGFEELYNGGGGLHGYCGVELGTFDEAADTVQIKYPVIEAAWCRKKENARISLIPTTEQFEKANALVDKLHPDLRKLCPEFGIYIVNSSS